MNNIDELLKFKRVEVNLDNNEATLLENRLGIRLSDEVKYFWLFCTALIVDESEVYTSPFNDIDSFIDEIDDLYLNFAELNEFIESNGHDNKIKPIAYSKKWLPLFVIDGLYVFLDFDPGDDGQIGQVIVADMMGGDEGASLVANSLNDLIGKINHEEKCGHVNINIENKTVHLDSNHEEYDFFSSVGIWEE